MRAHLTDPELTETLRGEPAGDTGAHLAECPICRAERDRLQAALAALTVQARMQAERPEESWAGQRRQIASRLRDRLSPRPGRRWAWVPAAVGLGVVTWLWFHGRAPQTVPEPTADHALLLAIERSIQTEYPAALRPAALLAAEVERREAETERGTGTRAGDQL